MRSDNWNEKLGVVRAEDVAVVAGSGSGPVQPVTLRRVLENLGHFGGYAGLEADTDLFDASLDAKCSIRFQTTFIPVKQSLASAGKLEFATEAYNYNTMDDSDPRNLVLLCTTQGMAVQQDGRGAKRLFHHAVDGDGLIHRYWLEAEESRHQVGGEQRETAEERAIAQARGKATSSVIGIRAMGQRFNVLMTIQVPLQQASRKKPKGMAAALGLTGGGAQYSGMEKYCMSLGGGTWNQKCMISDSMEDDRGCRETLRSLKCKPRGSRGKGSGKGVSSAARVSRGTEHDVWGGLGVKKPKRCGEHVTVTVVIYNTAAWPLHNATK